MGEGADHRLPAPVGYDGSSNLGEPDLVAGFGGDQPPGPKAPYGKAEADDFTNKPGEPYDPTVPHDDAQGWREVASDVMSTEGSRDPFLVAAQEDRLAAAADPDPQCDAGAPGPVNFSAALRATCSGRRSATSWGSGRTSPPAPVRTPSTARSSTSRRCRPTDWTRPPSVALVRSTVEMVHSGSRWPAIRWWISRSGPATRSRISSRWMSTQ